MSSAPASDRFGPAIHRGDLIARLAGGPGDLEAALALRALAFRGDAGADDRDTWDAQCLHLLVGIAGGPALAALRLQPHRPGTIRGYSAGLYDLSALAAAPGAALELGRLCLHPDHRDPDLMRLIWAGVTRVAQVWDSARLIGCTSFPGTDPDRFSAALGLLAQLYKGPEGLLPGRRALQTRSLADWSSSASAAGKGLIPPLIRAYLALGGWVSDHLVIDDDLGTCHVFTCVEIAAMPEGRKRVLQTLAGQGAADTSRHPPLACQPQTG